MDKDYIKLADETTIEIEDGGALSNLKHIAESESEAVAVCNKLTRGNLQHIEFYHEGIEEPYGVYDNMILMSAPTRADETDEDEQPTGRVIVSFSLRVKTDLEIRVDALEESQALQDGAIEDIADVVSEIAEEG